MNKISDAFAGKKAFVAYLMAGDPTLEKSAEYILAAQRAGADLIEVGIPFSDPIAEGEVIQGASVRALAAGTTLEGVFQMLASIKDRLTVPVVFMTYLNPVFVYGCDRFFARCGECGVCGIIIPDLPFEERDEVQRDAARHAVELVTMVAPTSSERVGRIAKSAEGFIYLVSSLGVTGMRSEITTDIPGMVQEIRRCTDLPVAVGFGISTPEQAGACARDADGVIVGSAIVKLIARHGEDAGKALESYIASMKAATRI